MFRASLSSFVVVLAALTSCSVADSESSQAPEGVVRTFVPLQTGLCWMGKDHVLGPPHSSADRIPFSIYAFYIEGASGERLLFDLGPESLAYSNAMFRRFGIFRDLGPDLPLAERYPDDIVQPEGNVFAQLRARGISPETIDHIVFSHLHADHHGMDDATDGGAAEHFPNALLHVSRRGWEDNLSKRVGGQWRSYVDYAFSDFLLRREAEGHVRFHDNAEIVPGVRTLYLGGHAPCSQALALQTESGAVLVASDDVYLYELLEQATLPLVRVSEKAYWEALDRLVEHARREKAVILPLHDPLVAEAYREAGPRWLEVLRERSDRAVAGYLARRDAMR